MDITEDLYTISVEQVVEYLNRLAAEDPAAISDLVLKRVACDFTDDSPVFVSEDAKSGLPYVGLLGILNGMFPPVNDRGAITVVLDDEPEENILFCETSRLAQS